MPRITAGDVIAKKPYISGGGYARWAAANGYDCSPAQGLRREPPLRAVGPTLPTFVFADLAGFTAMTEAHGDDEAADVAEAFVAAVRARLAGHGATEVKTMGDAVMLHVEDASRALCLAECIVGELGRDSGALGVRVGVHTGPAVQRGHDWYGTTVNVAARVAALAVADEVLLTRATADAAASHLAARRPLALGRRALKNVGEPVELLALTSPDVTPDITIDPVCRMRLRLDGGAVERVFDGETLRFCSRRCAEVFDRQPELFAGRAARHCR